MIRMLLSHNFNLYKGELPALNREQFAQVFIDGLQSENNISCKLIKNPHWIVEILYPEDSFSAKDIGEMCGQILLNKRSQLSENQKMPDILFLGGQKTTPVTTTSETSLKQGDWGVDVVETVSAQIFLDSINWDNMVADKPKDSVFKIEYLGKNS